MVDSPIMIDPTGSFGYGVVPALRNPMLEQAKALLEQQAASDTVSRTQHGAAPNANMYGIFSNAYAQSLARPTGAAGGDLLRQAALGEMADDELDRYEAALGRAGATALATADREGYYDLWGHVIDRESPAIIDNTRQVVTGPDGRATVQVDPIGSVVDSQLRGNQVLSETRQRNAGAVKDLYESGVETPTETVSGYMTAPTQATPDRYGVFNNRGFNPGDENTANELPIKQQEADAAMIAAEAQRYRAIHGDRTITQQWFPGAEEPITTIRDRGNNNGNPAPAPQGAAAQPTAQQQARIAGVQRHGAQVQMSGNILVVVDQNGRQYLYGPDGRIIEQAGTSPGGE